MRPFAVATQRSEEATPRSEEVTQRTEEAAQRSEDRESTEGGAVPASDAAGECGARQPAASLSARLAPWLESLRQQLHELALEAVRTVEGSHVLDSDTGSDDEDTLGGSATSSTNGAEVINTMQRLGSKIGGLLQLIHDDLLPRLPTDPDVLFLAAAGHFISRDFDGALRLARESLMAQQRCSAHEAARRHYFLAVCAIKILNGGSLDLAESRRRAAARPVGGAIPDRTPVTGEKRDELLALTETHLLRAIDLGGASFTSPYIDLDIIGALRHPNDLAVRLNVTSPAHGVH